MVFFREFTRITFWNSHTKIILKSSFMSCSLKLHNQSVKISPYLPGKDQHNSCNRIAGIMADVVVPPPVWISHFISICLIHSILEGFKTWIVMFAVQLTRQQTEEKGYAFLLIFVQHPDTRKVAMFTPVPMEVHSWRYLLDILGACLLGMGKNYTHYL